MSKKKDDCIVTLPEGMNVGDIAYDTTSDSVRIYGGTSWETLSGVSSTVRGRPYESIIKELTDLIEKNLECGNLIDWDIKVKDTELARKMYKEFSVKGGWLYAKKI